MKYRYVFLFGLRKLSLNISVLFSIYESLLPCEDMIVRLRKTWCRPDERFFKKYFDTEGQS